MFRHIRTIGPKKDTKLYDPLLVSKTAVRNNHDSVL